MSEAVTHLNQPRASTPADRSAATSPSAEARKTRWRGVQEVEREQTVEHTLRRPAAPRRKPQDVRKREDGKRQIDTGGRHWRRRG